MADEVEKRNINNVKKKLEFHEINEQLKMNKLNKYNSQDYEGTKSYFPFTHGDDVEEQRKRVNQLMKAEYEKRKRELHL